MARIPVNPLAIDWAGENPGMYLKDTTDGPFVTVISFFRVTRSPHGRGHALLLLEAPQSASMPAGRVNVCLNDNERLARWLVTEFASNFGAFKGVPALRNLAYLPLSSVSTSGDAITSYTERVSGSGMDVELTWDKLGDSFFLELPVDRSATGKHEMFSLFVNCGEARAMVNGRPLAGKSVPRDMQGHPSTTAFLAFSETWLRA